MRPSLRAPKQVSLCSWACGSIVAGPHSHGTSTLSQGRLIFDNLEQVPKDAKAAEEIQQSEADPHHSQPNPPSGTQPTVFHRTHRPLGMQEDAGELQDQCIGWLVVGFPQRVWEKAGAGGLNDHLQNRMGHSHSETELGTGAWGPSPAHIPPSTHLSVIFEIFVCPAQLLNQNRI